MDNCRWITYDNICSGVDSLGGSFIIVDEDNFTLLPKIQMIYLFKDKEAFNFKSNFI
jgi:hypothetical protein